MPDSHQFDERQYDPAVPYVSVPEAARALDVSDQALRNALREGRLPCVRLFGRYLLDPTDVDAYRARTRPGGIKPAGRPPRPTGNS